MKIRQIVSEVDHFHQLRKSRGEEFLETLLAEPVVVNVKIDQTAIVLKKKNGKVDFFGRHGKQRIGHNKRVIMNLYDKAINFLSSKNTQSLPDNLEVFMELFDPNLKTKVTYRTTPRNNLIISYARLNGEMVLPNEPLIKQIAKVLDVSEPPILFDGKLTFKQKELILRFVQLDEEDRREHFSEDNFLQFILQLFVPPSSFKWLESNGFEGVVFYFKDSQYTAKMVDPMFTAGVQTEHESGMTQFRTNMLDIVFKYLKEDANHIMNNFTTSLIEPSESLFTRYIADLTKYMTTLHSLEFTKAFEHHKNEQKARRFAQLSFNLLPPFMRHLITQYWWAEEIFVLLTNLLQKERVKVDIKRGLTSDRRNVVNDIVYKLQKFGIISDYI